MKISSYTASGLATGTMPSMTVSIKSANGTTKITKKSSNKKKKQLNYNPREISSAILRASKSQTAGRVTVQAKSKLSNLLKCKGTGQYDEGELNVAIVHARRMVQCARLKTQNLREEERTKKRYENEARAEQRQEKNEAKAHSATKERNIEQKRNIERIQRVQKQKSQKRELIRKRKFHRSQEQSKLNEADTEYFKQKIRGLREPYSANVSSVTLDLSTEAMQMTELQMTEELKQLEQLEQTEQLAQLEQQAFTGSGMEGMSATGNIGGGVAAPAAASVNVTI